MGQIGQAPAFNILLDRLPNDYHGWLIRTDYRIGIQISLCLQDEELTQEERITEAIYLLFGNGQPPIQTAVEAISWFLQCGQQKREDAPAASSPQRFWFDFDHARICASFQKTFGIELHKVSMHWFEFMAMLDCVDEDSSLSNAIQLRGTDTSKMKGKQRRDIERAKKLLTPPVQYTESEKEAIDEFFSKIN